MSDKRLRMTVPTLDVLRLLVDDPTNERYGFDLSKEAHLAHGTTYGILVKLEGWGWLRHRDEPNPERGKPTRVLYHLTNGGLQQAQEALGKARNRASSTRKRRSTRLIHNPGSRSRPRRSKPLSHDHRAGCE